MPTLTRLTHETMVFDWCKRDFMVMSQKFRAAQPKMDRCRWCKDPFQDGEMMALARLNNGKTVSNVVLCRDCADQMED
jgi:hypothetical protein